jgi:uncharacterized protein YdaU (DUF1376 family)
LNGLPYYKAYPRDFLEGTIGMSFELKGAYRLVLDLIYMQGGRLPDDARYISGLLGCSTRAWNKYRDDLIAAGKLTSEDGVISNFRARKELESLAKVQDRQRENASGPRKNKGLEKPRLNHTEPEPDSIETDVSIHPRSPPEKPKLEPKARLPADWALSDAGWAYARSMQIPDEVIRDEARGFHAYWSDRRDRDASKSARGWEATWENRCRTIANRYRGMAGKQASGGYGRGGSIASLAARRRAAGEV